LLERVRAGDRPALDELIARHRKLLRAFVALRLDANLRGRFDASDVVQEAQLEVARRIDDYLERQPMPFHLWLRKTAYENLLRLRRQNVEAECRTVNREVGLSERSSVLLARKVLGGDKTPSQHLIDRELARRVRAGLAQLPDVDQEILILRTFEGLSNQEVAQVLDLEPAATSKRYGRALLRLRKLLVTSGVQGPEG
jgi:RNA polymerase sigma-70 factor (ECF subfamily)